MTVSNLTELERRVADVLHHHAEIAMTTTDTETRYDAFAAGIESSVRHRRVTWGIGAVAAAAAIVIALVLGGVPGLSSNEADTQLPARARTPVQIATDFVNALAAYDAAKAAQDVGTSEGNLHIWPGEPSLRDGLAWAEAARYKVLPKDCVGERWSGSIARVMCPVDLHFLGSDRLGQPPQGGDIFVSVRGGRIVGASDPVGWYAFGLRQDLNLGMWAPFVPWLEREHLADVPAMITVGEADGLFDGPVWTDESRAPWAKHVDEWVASQQ